MIAADADGAIAQPGVTRVPAPPGLFYAGGAPDALERGGGGARAAAFTARLTAAVARRAARWDAVVAHWLAPSALAALPSRGPMLAIAHGGDVHLLARRRLLVPTVAALAARRARVTFVSDELAARTRAALPAPLARWLDDAACVQPMGVDLARFAAIADARATAPPPPRPRLLVLARLVPIKGVDVVLDALSHLRAPVDLVIAGDGPHAEELRRRAASHVGAHAVHWRGAIDADARDAELARASLVVVPSRALPSGRAEGHPMVAAEALAAGVPLVVTRTGGLAGLGPPVVHAAPDDPADLARAIDRALARPAAAADLRALAAPVDWRVVEARLRGHGRL
ncbi:MAG: glycosyltransferase family 4 protein [Kofleriaceae bacterium]